MKRTAMQHTKLKRLVRALKVPQYAAVGILESLWHLTAREAPEGNIGKLSNEDIAAWIDWECDSDELINALITAGWIDHDTDNRLVIHDWHEHADDATKLAIKRKAATKSEHVGQTPTTCDKTPLPEPEPEPEPLPEPEKNTLASTAVAVPAGKLVCTLPIVGGAEHSVYEPDVQQWVALYPAVDVRQELRNLKGWLLGNPRLQKTKSGINRFINSWLSRAQNEAKPGGGNVGRNFSKTGGNLDATRQAIELFEQAERNREDAGQVQHAEGVGGDGGDLSHLRAGSIEL